ncbi:MAG: hypothetical protein JXK07_00490, partial [Spirochaetes bacterium]|nr:hypothetical protein [Spirochaetota bacterium]MBN2769507.1 hypothetical protein [Spirochaetota bacterium]
MIREYRNFFFDGFYHLIYLKTIFLVAIRKNDQKHYFGAGNFFGLVIGICRKFLCSLAQHHFEKQSGAGMLAYAAYAGRKMTLAARILYVILDIFFGLLILKVGKPSSQRLL